MSYQCEICDGCETVSESSSQYSGSDGEYSSDCECPSETDSKSSDEWEIPKQNEERSDEINHSSQNVNDHSSNNDVDEEIKNKYEGFDKYPPEIQAFIKQKEGVQIPNEDCQDNGDNSIPVDIVKPLEERIEVLLSEEEEEKNKEALENILSDEKIADDQAPHTRTRRAATRHRKHDSHSHKKHYKGSENGWRMAKIICPSGKSYAITMPARDRTDWKCDKKSKLITLKKDGFMGKREYTIVSKEMENTRVAHSSGSFSKYDIIKIEKIVNPCLWKRYRYRRWQIIRECGDANDHLLWHGSSHVQELIHTGFDERHASPSGMFGAGLYFAPNSSKSNQYVLPAGCAAHKNSNCFVCERQLLLCRVSLGKIMQYSTYHNHSHAPVGYHSVEGVAGASLKYNENVVYRGEQVYPEFVITYKLVP